MALPKPDEIAQFVDFVTDKYLEAKETSAVCGCPNFDNFATTTIQLLTVPMFKSNAAQRFGVTHDCVLVSFKCKSCNTADIPLTIELGPASITYVERWGSYSKFKDIGGRLDRNFTYIGFKKFIAEYQADGRYSLLTYNCKDFAWETYVYLFNKDESKYYDQFHIFVPSPNNLSTFHMAWRLLKILFFLPYQHFIYWTCCDREEIPRFEFDGPDFETLFNEQERIVGDNVDPNSGLTVKILSINLDTKKTVVAGPIDFDSVRTYPSETLGLFRFIQLELIKKRISRELSGNYYSDTKTRSFKFLDFFLYLQIFMLFKFYVGFLLFFNYEVKPHVKRVWKANPLLFWNYHYLKGFFYIIMIVLSIKLTQKLIASLFSFILLNLLNQLISL